jgi:hypothetical protein
MKRKECGGALPVGSSSIHRHRANPDRQQSGTRPALIMPRILTPFIELGRVIATSTYVDQTLKDEPEVERLGFHEDWCKAPVDPCTSDLGERDSSICLHIHMHPI